MSNRTKQKLTKFLQDAEKIALPTEKDLWKRWFEVAELYGIESK